ncbi:MAG: aminocarboxymuconate-semialdehyde decarboxylase [Betaproteobacteria bacterium RIFCSPLOWO2_02_FULL_65_24]|nr:MAG: aminocarboxymuconate-semialdehyde decarboxylase [Betaproteobacteria bacterium RIFCSPLOWO2_02_FULL_65_24]
MTQLRALDIHSHIVPEQFPAYTGVGRNIPWPSMAPAHACHAHVMIEGKVYRTVHQSCWLPEERVRDMDQGLIGVQCLSPMPELLSYWLPAADAQLLIRFLNDEIAKMVDRHPRRFMGLGAVPLQDMDLALRELEYIVNELKFPGVEIASHVNGVSIGDPRFEPFFAAVEKMGAAIFVHALRPAGQDRIVGGVAEQVVCFPGDIGLAAASMITGGIAERHPELRIAFSHGGGVFSFLVPRLTRAWEVTPKMKQAIPQSPGVYAKRFYYDTIVFDPAALRHIIHSFGASQIVVGSDYPFNLGDPDPVASVNAAGLDAGTVRAIVHENAERFLGRTLE